MSLVVITGAARSGKSSAAQQLAVQRQADGATVTVAVFGRPTDDEMAARIERHRKDRPEGFATLELTSSAVAADGAHTWITDVPGADLLVVECLGTMLGLTLERLYETHAGTLDSAEASTLPPGLEERAERAIVGAVDALIRRAGDTIVVTNEVGWGVVPEWASGRLFRDLLGGANRRLVDAADAAYLAVAGRLMNLEAMPRAIDWPED